MSPMITRLGKGSHGGMVDLTKKAKSLRNAENRRQKSKVAARTRRGEETKIFHDLSDFLPFPDGVKSHLDKVSVVRLTLCGLILRKLFPPGNEECLEIGTEFDSQVNQALGGFILVFSLDGDVIYASSGVSEHLGISESEIMGHSIFDLAHSYDHPEIRGVLKTTPDLVTGPKSALFRLKCSVASSRGRHDTHNHCSSYKMMECIGRPVKDNYFLAICEPLCHPADGQLPPRNKSTWISRHSPDLKFLEVDDISKELGYEEKDLQGRSLFEFNHAQDEIGGAFKFLTDKEQNTTEPYRFLVMGGGWIWMITQATLIHGSGCGGCPNKSPDYVVCLHWMMSGVEEADVIVSQVQMLEEENGLVVMETPSTSTIDLELLSEITGAERGNFEANSVMTPDEENAIIADLLVPTYLTQGQEEELLEEVGDTLMAEVGQGIETLDLEPIAPVVPLDVTLLQNLLASLDVDDILELESNESRDLEGQIAAGDSSPPPISPVRPPSLAEEGQSPDRGQIVEYRGQSSAPVELQGQGQVGDLLAVTKPPIITSSPPLAYVVSGSGPTPPKLQLMGVDSSPEISEPGGGGLFMLVPVSVGAEFGAGSGTGVVGNDSNYSSQNSSDSLDSAGQLDLINLVRAQQLQIAAQAEINRELLARIELIEEESGVGVRRNSIGKRNSDRSLVIQHHAQVAHGDGEGIVTVLTPGLE